MIVLARMETVAVTFHILFLRLCLFLSVAFPFGCQCHEGHNTAGLSSDHSIAGARINVLSKGFLGEEEKEVNR